MLGFVAASIVLGALARVSYELALMLQSREHCTCDHGYGEQQLQQDSVLVVTVTYDTVPRDFFHAGRLAATMVNFLMRGCES